MDKNTHVYCTECANFRLDDETKPYCPFEDECDIYDCEDSRPFGERPRYEKRVKSSKQQSDLGVDILLKDGTYLSNAVIFPNDAIGIGSLINEEDIIDKFEARGYENFIYFQTIYINGKFHPSNVRWYDFTESQ